MSAIISWVMSKMGLSTYLMIAMAVLAGLFYFYYSYTQKELSGLKTENNMLTLANKNFVQQIQDTALQIKQIQQANDELNQTVRDNEIQKEKLYNTLSKLDKISTKKAKLLEDLINEASSNRIDCIKMASGDVSVKGNKLCPQFKK